MSKNNPRELNPEQKTAVMHGAGPLLIIAGAGTGKTSVITERIKHLILDEGIQADEILALTFTEKSAREMEERVDEALPYGYTQLWISTFHSFCDRILKSHGIHIGLDPRFRLLSDTDATLLLRRNLFSLDLDYFRPLGNPNKFIAGMLTHFSRLKDEDITPEQYLRYVQEIKNKKSKIKSEEEELEIQKFAELARVYEQYELLKQTQGVMDFSDLISNTLELFRTRKNVLVEFRRKFKFILIDEFQDTNVSQYELIKLLAPVDTNPNITVVGDDNQSIYKFRGAAVSNILSFKTDYPKSAEVILNKNYRSYQYILDASYKLIKHNDPDTLEARLGISKKLESTKGNFPKQKVQFLHADRVENEAEQVAKNIKHQISHSTSSGHANIKNEKGEKYTWKDFAILVRANNHAEPFVRAFTRLGIPFQFLGPGQLLRQNEIKDLIAYLQILVNFEDNLALYRILSMEYFHISPRDLVALSNFAKKISRSLFEALEYAIGIRTEAGIILPHIEDGTKQQLVSVVGMITKHLGMLTTETAGQLLYYFLLDSGMLGTLLQYKNTDDEKRAANISTFFGKIKTFEAEHEDASVQTVLDWILLSMELGESPTATDGDWSENDAVNILTVHSSKGLEFPVVFLVNLVSQRFPSTERKEQIPIPESLIKEELPQGDFHLQEERRLFYVGMTRAKDFLYLTAANFYGEGKREKKISPFVYETLGAQLTEDLYTGGEKQLSLLDWNKMTPESHPEASPAEGTQQKQSSTPPVKVTYLSYSQIETFKTCPLHYKLKYVLKIPTPTPPAAAFGSTMHAALQQFYMNLKSGEKVNEEILLELFNKNWNRTGYGSKEYEAAMKARGEKYLRNYFSKEFNPHVKPLVLEELFSLPIKTQERFLRVGGKIDRVDDLGDGAIEIIDYKTGKLPSKRELNTNMQLSIYALAATEIRQFPFNKKVEQVKLTLYYFDSQEKVTLMRTAEQLSAEKEKIVAIAQEIEKSDFRCSHSPICVNCEYKLFCGG